MNAPVTKIKNQRSEPQNSPTEVRTAYSFFHEKRTKNAAGVIFTKKTGEPNPRWSSTFLLLKRGDAATCPNYLWLWSLAQEAARKMWPQNVDAAGNWTWPAGAQLAIKDGDVPIVPKPKPGVPQPTAEEIAKRNEWRRGYWVIEAENFLDPGPRIAKIINGQAVDLPARVVNGVEQYKSGDWGFVNLHAYAYQNETFGVNFGFDGFLFTREGERIGNASGPKSTAQMFGGIAPAATPGQVAAPAPAVQAYAPPVQPAMPMPPTAQVAPQYAAPAMAAPMPPQPPVAPAAPAPGGVGLPPLPPGVPGR